MENHKISSCQNCKHAEIDNNVQTGCAINKLSNFTESNSAELNNESGYYDLLKVCLFKNKELKDVKTPVGYIFILKDESKIELLKNNIENILDKNPIWIGIIHNLVNLADDIIDKFSYISLPINIICNHNEITDVDSLDLFMKNYKNGWTIVNIVGEDFNTNLVTTLDFYLSTKTKPIALIKSSEDSVNEMCFYNFIYKFLKGSKLEVNSETQEIIDKSYEEKVAESSIDMIKTWKEINEINNSFTS